MIKAILFDLDGTLYKSDDIRQQFTEAAYHTLAKYKDISLEDARAFIEERRDELKKQNGYPVPYTLTLISYGIPIEFWHKENVKFFDPRDYLTRDEKMRKAMMLLKTQCNMAVLTNNNDIQSERILEALGVRDQFDKLFTFNTFELLKPNPLFFKKAVQELGVKLEEALMVGDRYDVDLIPAKKLGMQIYEVKEPEDIYKIRSVIHEKTV